MAKIKDSALVGMLGNLVGCKYKDSYYLRRAPVRTSPRTEGELISQNNFRLIINWLKPVAEFVKVGLKNPKMSGFNRAQSLLSKGPLQKDGFNSTIDPTLAVLSEGSLENAENLQVQLNGDLLEFTWDPSPGKNKASRDRILLLAYNVEKASSAYDVSGAQRQMGQEVLKLPSVSGMYHIYAAFKDADAKRQSNSVYLGAVEKS